MIAALFVLKDGPYAIPGIDLWDEERDARKYKGPYPVIAHPPCQRWGRYWSGGPSARVRCKKGDDNGCFESALRSVRKWGGVLEHPEASYAWVWYGLEKPPKRGGWVVADDFGGQTCCVEQGHYGHKARKATWLYFYGREELPELKWGAAAAAARLDLGFHNKEERRRAIKTGVCQRLSRRQRLFRRQRLLTPLAFRNLLVDLVRGI